jgi:hypothetical protein
MYNGEGMKKGRLCKTAFATICESKEGSKSTTDSENVGVCLESKSSISSAEDIEDIEEMADFGTESHSFKFSISVTWTEDDRQFGNYRCFRHKFENLCYNFGRKEEMESKRRSGEVKKLEIRISNCELKVKL